MLAEQQTVTGKRKRTEEDDGSPKTSIQIIAGSYDRTLIGSVANITSTPKDSCAFTTNFLFNAHASSIRSLAISPPTHLADQAGRRKRFLATGGADEKINIYQISATRATEALSTSIPQPVNRELGSLLHHSSTVTTLAFPSKGKLLSASLDNTIAISRLRDWTVLSTIRAPVPNVQGRPSGDTAAPGEVPAGINDIAVHPSAKLCLSVGQGEKSMRLWNLVTGKKEGVLTFSRYALTALGESRWRGGEARSIVFSPDGEEFAVGFEHGAIIYGLDCEIRGIAIAEGTKVCRVRYGLRRCGKNFVLAMSTEDGRVLFFDTSPRRVPKTFGLDPVEERLPGSNKKDLVAHCSLLAELGVAKRSSRIKDFVIVENAEKAAFVVTSTSSGTISVWSLQMAKISNLSTSQAASETTDANRPVQVSSDDADTVDRHAQTDQIIRLLGTHETGKRITCLEAFVIEGPDAIGRISQRPTAVAGDGQ